MIVFLYGSDAYRLRQARQNIIEEYKKKHSSGVNIFFFDLNDVVNVEKLSNSAKSMSFFDEHKLIIVSNAFAKKTTSEIFFDVIKKEDIISEKNITLLITETSSEKEITSKNKNLFKLLLSEKSVVKVFNPLEGANLNRWVQKEFENRGCSVSYNELSRLISIVGNDSWTLINEVEKLSAHKGRGEIGAGDVDLLVSSVAELNIFELIDAIALRNNKKSIELLYVNLALGNDPYYLMSMIIGQFRNLLMVKDLYDRGISQPEIVKKTGLHPFVVKKTLYQIEKFDSSELKQKHNQLQKIDIFSKRGSTDLVGSLYSFLFL